MVKEYNYRKVILLVVFFFFDIILFLLIMRHFSDRLLKPNIKMSNVTEIQAGMPFSEENYLELYGDNLKDIVGVWLNGEWVSSIQFIQRDSTHVSILFPEQFVTEEGTIKIQLEQRKAKKRSVLSNNFILKVAGKSELPMISKTEPVCIQIDGTPYTEIVIRGENIREGDYAVIGETEYSLELVDNDLFRIKIPFVEYALKDEIELGVCRAFEIQKNIYKSDTVKLKVVKKERSPLNYEWTTCRYIAHAFGMIDGKTYTNTLEAFLHNYELGHRIFEVDFNFTSDEVLMCRHYFHKNNFGISGEIFEDYEISNLPKTWQQMKNAEGEYTLLNFADVCHLMMEYPDIYIVTDTKYVNANAIYKVFSSMVQTANEEKCLQVLDRLIVQIYNQEMYEQVRAIYPFKSIIYTLYMSDDSNEEVFDFVLKNDIKVITMSESRFEDQNWINRLNDAGCMIYVHTINDINKAKDLGDQGVYGLYTDELLDDSTICEAFAEYKKKHEANMDIPQKFTDKKDAEEYQRKISYLRDLKSDRYLICTMICDNQIQNASKEMEDAILELGLNAFSEKEKGDYIAIIDSGKVVFEKKVESEYTGDTLRIHDILFGISYTADYEGEKSNFVVETKNKKYTLISENCCFWVYDFLTEEVIDYIAF